MDLEFSKEWLKEKGLVWNGRSLPYNGKLIDRARALRREMTKEEKKLWYEFLQKYPLKFYKQRIIDHYIVDFYCPIKKLVVEVDGSHHFTKEGIVLDSIRTDVLEIYGVSVLRFTNRQVLDDILFVRNEIDNYIKSPFNLSVSL